MALVPVPGRAEVSASQILKMYDTGNASERGLIEANLGGLENGFGWANTYLQSQRQQTPLYCLPDKLALKSEQIIDILRRGVREDAKLGNAPFGLAILVALQRVFPCRQ
ncbi:MAG TPA: hypothetical protein VNL39_00245 [Xanthobacteraceae bacterium]|nr:hypothetical protein [Xanthobacteraceae bacterium]